MYKKVEDGLVRGWSFVGWKYWPCREKKFKISMLNEAVFMVKLRFEKCKYCVAIFVAPVSWVKYLQHSRGFNSSLIFHISYYVCVKHKSCMNNTAELVLLFCIEHCKRTIFNSLFNLKMQYKHIWRKNKFRQWIPSHSLKTVLKNFGDPLPPHTHAVNRGPPGKTLQNRGHMVQTITTEI